MLSARFISLPASPNLGSAPRFMAHFGGRTGVCLFSPAGVRSLSQTLPLTFLQRKRVSADERGSGTPATFAPGRGRDTPAQSVHNHPWTVLKVGRGSAAHLTRVRARPKLSPQRHSDETPAPPLPRASRLPSRAAAPPNQRPLCTSPRFKLQLGWVSGFSAVGAQQPWCAGHGSPHRGARPVPGHQAGE